MNSNNFEVIIKGVISDSLSSCPAVILQEKNGENIIPVLLSPAEAGSIIGFLAALSAEKVQMHDFLFNFFYKHNYTAEKLEIYAYFNSTFYSRLYYKKGVKKYSMDIATADGLALCLRFGASIFMSSSVSGFMPFENFLLKAGDEASGFFYLETSKKNLYHGHHSN
jgi:bifunctional DNase/RNase